MTTPDKSAHPKLDNILVATDFSSASKTALLYAMSIARRHTAKLFSSTCQALSPKEISRMRGGQGTGKSWTNSWQVAW